MPGSIASFVQTGNPLPRDSRVATSPALAVSCETLEPFVITVNGHFTCSMSKASEPAGFLLNPLLPHTVAHMPAAACCVLQAVTTWPQWQANFGIASGDDLLYIDINSPGRITRSDAEAMRCSLWDEIRMWMDDNGRWVHGKPT